MPEEGRVCGVRFFVNGVRVEESVPSDLPLLTFLREHLNLTGTKNGCGKGHCGACTVIIDGRARRACRIRMGSVSGKHVLTIEGIGTLANLHPLQKAFVDSGAVQCGFCTPGMIMSAKALLDRNPDPSVDEIKTHLKGNLCRCAGYPRILEAVRSAGGAGAVRGEPPSGARPQGRDGRFIGKSLPRRDAGLKVTGALQYAADMKMDGMLHGRILWSAHPHAGIVSVDTSQAMRLPGVRAVLTSKDVAGTNDLGFGQPVLAGDKVRYVGDPVAVVFADSEGAAGEALGRIRVEYKVLKPVFSPLEALDPSSPRIHDGGNIDHEMSFDKGDVDAGFGQADVIVQESYDTPFVEHAYLEVEAGIAASSEDGEVTVWICTQMPRYNRDLIAEAIRIPAGKLRFASTPCGGAFGGKFTITIHALLALGAQCTGRAVKIVLTREESMRMHPKRNAVHLEYKVGATRSGRLTALQATILSDQGAYSPIGKLCLEQMMVFAPGPYSIPNIRLEGRNLYTNKTPGGAMRGFGVNMVAFAMESTMDILARKLGMDPFELRLINGLEVGQSTGGGQVLKSSVAVKQCLNEARARLEAARHSLETDQKIGIGVAAGFKNVGGGGSSGATAEVTPEGKVAVKIECPDIGQGSDMVIGQIASETLGVEYEDVVVISGDTHLAPATGFTGAQRVTVNAGNAVMKACRSLKEAMGRVAGVSVPGGAAAASLSEMWEAASRAGIALRSEEYHEMPQDYPLSPTGNLDRAIDPELYANYPTYSYVVHVALVTVDGSSGRVKVLKVIAVHDAGKVINPLNCESQIEGATMMGLGYALQEEFVIEGGWNRTTSLKACRIPTIQDVPEIEIVLVEDPEPLGPFQAKGLSEAATVAVTPAIINAIYDAAGVRITTLPANEKRVLEALQKARMKEV